MVAPSFAQCFNALTGILCFSTDYLTLANVCHAMAFQCPYGHSLFFHKEMSYLGDLTQAGVSMPLRAFFVFPPGSRSIILTCALEVSMPLRAFFVFPPIFR